VRLLGVIAENEKTNLIYWDKIFDELSASRPE